MENQQPNNLKQVALDYINAGLPVIPVGSDKLPIIPSWKQFQSRIPTTSEVEAWFKNNNEIDALALIAGNGITIFDFDHPRFYEMFKKKANGQMDGLPIQQSGKGYHLAFRSDLEVPNKKLAKYYDNDSKVKIGIETRGEGGYILIAPSLHAATGKLYRSIVGSFNEIPVIDKSLAEELISIAESLDETKKFDMSAIETDISSLDRKVIDEFNKKHTIHDLLIKHGYRKKRNGKYLAPDSESGNAGVLVNKDKGKEYCVSFHADAIGEDQKGHDAFDLFRLLEHAGNYREAIDAADKQTGVSDALMPTLIDIDLMLADLPEPQFVIPRFLPEGLTILAGKPKVGKSWMALEMCIEVARGGVVLGEKVEKGRAIYFALEDSKRRLKSRLHKLLPDEKTTPEGLLLGEAGAVSRLHQGGCSELTNVLVKYPDTKLVVIDTLAKVKPPSKFQYSYDDDSKVMGDLQKIAIEHDIALVVVHHVRKAEAEDVFDMISGSMGLQGVADAMIVLNKIRGDTSAELSVTGRDLEDDLHLAVEFDKDTARWNVLGDAGEVKLSDARQAILDVLENHDEAMSPTDVANCLDVDSKNVKALLYKMYKADQVTRIEKGQYTIT